MRFTQKEIEILRSIDGRRLSHEEFQRLFPDRSIDKLRRKAAKLNLDIGILRSASWQSDEDIMLREIWSDGTREEILRAFPMRSWSAIQQRALKLSITRCDFWTDEQDQYLRDNFERGNSEQMALHLGRTWVAIKVRGWKMGLKRSLDNIRESELSVLLNGSMESSYWIGFLLADAHFHTNRRIQLLLAERDRRHMESFARYIQCPNIREGVIGGTYRNVQLSVQNTEVIPELCRRFDIHSNKTLHPPVAATYDLTDDQFLSLFIGFCDGDGCVTRLYNRTQFTIKIKNHASWMDNLLYFVDRLYSIFPYPRRGRLVNINGAGYACLVISNDALVREIANAGRSLDLPMMDRKWRPIWDELDGELFTPQIAA